MYIIAIFVVHVCVYEQKKIIKFGNGIVCCHVIEHRLAIIVQWLVLNLYAQGSCCTYSTLLID